MLLAVLNGPDTFVSDGGTCLGSSMRMISSIILGSLVVDFVNPISMTSGSGHEIGSKIREVIEVDVLENGVQWGK